MFPQIYYARHTGTTAVKTAQQFKAIILHHPLMIALLEVIAGGDGRHW
jgi:hypothetical protein